MPFIPLHDKNPRVTIGLPWVTWGLIAACILVYLWQNSLGEAAAQRAAFSLGMVPAVLLGDAQLQPGLALVPEWATLVTYQFLHGDLLHLVFNLAFLWVFGDNIEDAMGHARFPVFYLLCGALAALAHGLADPGARIPVIGASGAISGVLGAYLLLHPTAKILVPVILFIPFYLPAYLLLILWIGFQVYSATLPGAAASGVAWWAHIGGFVAGIALIPLFRHRTVVSSGGRITKGLKFRGRSGTKRR